jgi:site-specific recombinase XerD
MRLYRRNGVWYVEFARGKAKSLKTEDKTEAIRLFKKIDKAYTDRKLIWLEASERILLGQFAEGYAENRAGLKSDNTVRIDDESFEKLKSFAGDIPISYLSEKKCDDFVVYLQRQGFKATTINIAIRHLKAAFNKAVKLGYLEKSPFRNVETVKIKDDLPRALTQKQVGDLLSAIEEDREFKELVYAYLYTGGRRTEVARLRWQEIICLEDSWTVKLGQKTKMRTIPLANKLKDILFYRKKDIGPVFPYYNIHYREPSRVFRKYADEAGIDAKLHDLRHTCATFMALSGVPLREIQAILGHSTIKTTEIYTKIVAQHLRGAVDVLNF